MRDAAATADVGDDVYGEDPTVNELEATAAALLGKEAALLTPSGTMANQIAALTHTSPGQSVIVEAQSHIYQWEVGGLAVHAGLQPIPLDGGATGLYTADQLRSAIIDPEIHRAATGLITIENTHNHAGGVAHAPDDIQSLSSIATAQDIPIHLDGARLFNAAIARGVSPAQLAQDVDSVMFSLSKGLGAPVGSMLVGTSTFIDAARRHRKQLGGGMRQAGIIAAPALLGLEMWDRLEADHQRAERLAAGIASKTPFTTNDPETNIVLVDISSADVTPNTFLEQCRDAGVRGVPFGDTTVRFCTHYDITDPDIDRAIAAIASTIP